MQNSNSAMSIIGTQQPYVSLNEQYYLQNIIAEVLNTLCKRKKSCILFYPTVSHKKWRKTQTSPCLELKESFKYYHRSLY